MTPFNAFGWGVALGALLARAVTYVAARRQSTRVQWDADAIPYEVCREMASPAIPPGCWCQHTFAADGTSWRDWVPGCVAHPTPDSEDAP